MRRILTICCIAILSMVMLTMRPAHASGTFTWSVSPDTAIPQYDNSDIRPMIVTNGSTFYQIYSDGSNVVHRWLCTTLDACTEQANGTLDSSFNHPYGDDRYWLGGGILYGSTYYSVVHIEFRYHSTSAPNFSWFRRLGIASSTDSGLHWHYLGDAITSDFSTDINDFTGAPSFQTGPGDPALYADFSHSMVYISYTTFWADVVTGARSEQTNIARCPLGSIASVSCWRKFNYGNWNQLGLGGHQTALWMGQDNASIAWDSYLGAYVAIGHSTSNISFITTATSMDTQNWQPLQGLADGNRLLWYTWLVAPNGDPFTLGNVVRVYTSDNDYGGMGTFYFTVTLALA